MLDHCQPILINKLYGSLIINTNHSLKCLKPRQWLFFYDYGYTLLIRLINITHLLSKSYIFKIYSIINQQKTLVYDSTNKTIVNNEIQLDLREKNSGILLELISINQKNMQDTSFIIDYVFRDITHSRYGRQILQDNSSPSSSSSFSPTQPSFIALICIIGVLLIGIIVTIAIFCYRHCSYRQNSQKRLKSRRISTDQQTTDHTHLAASITSSSASSHSLRSTRHLSSQHHLIHTQQQQQQVSSLGVSTSTLPSILPSRRLQQSMIDAYLNDYKSFQPNTIDPKQLNSYLFIDLHSTSSDTYPDGISKQYVHDNTTTSGYDTSTGGDDRNYQNTIRYRRRRYHYNQRQRRRSTKTLKRSHGPRFLMRERSLPANLLKLPQLRQDRHLFGLDNHINSTHSNTNQDLISTNLSTTTDDYDESHAYHIQHSRTMNTIEEENPIMIHKSFSQQPYFFEMVSTNRGDDSDMPNYEDLRIPYKSSPMMGDGIAYVNDSIIV
ncbi:unnamed protein product [Adineta steineri]|uniref:Uncharacterized protein n=1 Tax=Adineta steineri TaxID=433720 RepID=A0A813ZFN3_9BILA|nr:unnamed protein product [Adineta steineri]CAF0917938.1 unnamed protein product [Adineta steineri]